MNRWGGGTRALALALLASALCLNKAADVPGRRTRHGCRLRTSYRLDIGLQGGPSVQSATVENDVLAQRTFRKLLHQGPNPDVIRKNLP